MQPQRLAGSERQMRVRCRLVWGPVLGACAAACQRHQPGHYLPGGQQNLIVGRNGWCAVPPVSACLCVCRSVCVPLSVSASVCKASLGHASYSKWRFMQEALHRAAPFDIGTNAAHEARVVTKEDGVELCVCLPLSVCLHPCVSHDSQQFVLAFPLC